MTPSTPAGGAVACPHRLACIDCGDEPATVPVEAVLALVGDLRTEGQREKDDTRERVRDRAYEKLDLANRLELLTRGEK